MNSAVDKIVNLILSHGERGLYIIAAGIVVYGIWRLILARVERGKD